MAEFSSANENTSVLIAPVDAHDVAHARTLAVELVERLADQYRARHRTASIEIDDSSLVLRLRGTHVHAVETSVSVLHEARARLSRPEQRLEQSLRYAALARTERAPVIKILHSWIALETLARGAGSAVRPYPFVMRYVSDLLALHGVRHGLATTWQISSRAGRSGPRRNRWLEVERWLGAGQDRRLPDLNRWLDLIRADRSGVQAPRHLARSANAAEAVALFDDLLPSFPPMVRRAVTAWRWRLSVGSRLSNWCDVMEHRAETALGRMYVIRNSSVHTALTQVRASEQLAHAASNIVDTVYEVIPLWLQSGNNVADAFDRIERRSRHVRRAWNAPRAPLLNADKLTMPGGDGLSQ